MLSFVLFVMDRGACVEIVYHFLRNWSSFNKAYSSHIYFQNEGVIIARVLTRAELCTVRYGSRRRAEFVYSLLYHFAQVIESQHDIIHFRNEDVAQ